MSLHSRLSASLITLTVSVVIFIAVWILIFFYIYPYPYSEISGGLKLFWMIVGIDLILGPMLAFLVAAPTKLRSALRRDLLVITVLQLSALTYGFSVMYSARPVYLVYEIDRFKVVHAQELTPDDLSLAPSALQKLPLAGVKIIGLRKAANSADKLSSLDLEIAGKGLYLQTNWWQPLSEENFESMRQRGQSVESLRQQPSFDSASLAKSLRASGLREEDVIALPLVTPATSGSLLLSRQSLQLVGYLPVDLF